MEMTDSILTSIKKLLGIDENYKHFDPDLVMHINSVLSILMQIGVGPAEGFLFPEIKKPGPISSKMTQRNFHW